MADERNPIALGARIKLFPLLSWVREQDIERLYLPDLPGIPGLALSIIFTVVLAHGCVFPGRGCLISTCYPASPA